MLSYYRAFWANYANFKGRSSRKQFWFIVLLNSLISLSFVVMLAILLGGLPVVLDYLQGQGIFLSLNAFELTWVRLVPIILVVFALFMIWLLLCYIPTLALQVRRLRDAGFNASFILFVLGDFALIIPYVGFVICLGCRITLLIFYCLPTKPKITSL
ncbi:DUF805 domain-containing protein [Streptococcus sp. zg-JUN1979]|uniref:DUF805 domain-containing protein n=1 Tax=Streptococcus sp. zg-JUN1979 TaxID=3391450 RepID=UPI0039A64136